MSSCKTGRGCSGDRKVKGLGRGFANQIFAASILAVLMVLIGGCTGLVSAPNSTSNGTLQLSPANVSFGNVAIGKKTSQSITILNTSKAATTIQQATLSNSQFALSGITTPMALQAGQTGTFSVWVNPAATGNLKGTLTIQGDPTSNPVVLNLSATGITTQQQISLSSAAVDFGAVGVGASGSSSLSISNTGASDLTVSVVSLTGAEFGLTGITTPKTISAGQSVPVSLSYHPTAAVASTGSLSILSNDPTHPTMTVALTGTGVQGGLSVSPTTFNFGSVVDGQTKAQIFTLTNSGTSAVTLSQIGITGPGYSVTGLTTPSSLAAGQSTTFSAQFAPAAAGSLSGGISITSSASNSPATVLLSGTGVAASVTVTASPSSLSFGNVNAGSASAKNVTLTNNGTASLTLSQITVNARDVKVSGIVIPITIAAGQTATLSATFSPASSESVTGDITVASTQGASAVIPISGSGVQAALNITPSSASFGNVAVGSTASQTIQLSNTGTAALTVSQLSVTGTGYSTGSVTLPITLNAGQASTFNIQYKPTAAGSGTGSVSVVSTAPNSPATITMSGTGVAATQALSLSATSLSFGNVNTGTSATHGVTVTNTGNASVTISQIGVSGAGFSLTGAAVPITLSSAQSLTLSVIFNPAAAGSVTGSVTVTSNASGSPATISLSGTGVQPATHSVTLDWTMSTSTVSGYNVYRSTVSGTGYTKINSGLVGSTTYTDSNVQSGTNYFYVTTSVDSSANESTYSNEALASIP
jgi:hypothetical protein